MAYFKTFKAGLVQAEYSSSVSASITESRVSAASASAGYPDSDYPTAWGILRATDGEGTIALEGGGDLFPIEELPLGVPFPCYVRGVTVTSGSIYILS